MARIERATVEEAASFAAGHLLQDWRVAGVGIANPKHKINVYVKREQDLWEVPGEIGGFETRPILAGTPRIFQPPDSEYQQRHRPAPGGVSIGPDDGSTGTFGCTVYNEETGERYILTNSHVAADSGLAAEGAVLYQPSERDGVLSALNRIGGLYKDVTLWPDSAAPNRVNEVDVALVKPNSEDNILDEILGVGVVDEAVPPVLNRNAKVASRNGFSTGGKVIDRSAVFKVEGYPESVALNPDGVLTFYNCVVVQPSMTAPGSSGAIIVDADTDQGIGLNFAGSETLTLGNWLTSALVATNTLMPGEFLRGETNSGELPSDSRILAEGGIVEKTIWEKIEPYVFYGAVGAVGLAGLYVALK